MTIQEKLTDEFSELDRVTARPLTHNDYAIAAIQFFQELYNFDLQNIVTEQQQAIEELERRKEALELLLEDHLKTHTEANRLATETIKELQEKVDYWEGKRPISNRRSKKDEDKNGPTENDKLEIWCEIIDFVIQTRLTGSTWKELDSKYRIERK